MGNNQVDTAKCPLCRAKEQGQFIGYKLKDRQGLFPARNYAEAEKVFSCGNCDLVYTHADTGQEAVFEKDDSLMRLTHEDAEAIKAAGAYPDILAFLKQAGLKPGAKALDIGSGIGRVAYVLRQQGYNTYAAEPKQQLYDFSIAHGFTEKDKIFKLPLEQLSFEKNSFDFIYFEPLNHLHSPGEGIETVLNWLKPGGYLHLEVVNRRWLYKDLLTLFYKLTFRKHVPYTSVHRKPFNACEYSERSFNVYAAQNKLEVCLMDTYACDTHIPVRFLSRIVEAMMQRFNKGMELSVILRKPL